MRKIDKLAIGLCFAIMQVLGAASAQTTLTGDVPFIGDQYGQAVAIDGNIAVVGARGDETNGDDSGAAYVYENITGTWTFLQKLTGDELQAQFGFSVAVVLDSSGLNEGDFIAVGSLLGEGVVASSGSVSIYRRLKGESLFSFQQTVAAGDGSGFDEFGRAVALDLSVPANTQSGDPVYTLVVGAPDEESGGVGFDQGAIYIFQLSPDGTAWSGIKKLVPDDVVGGDLFGTAVSIHGDVIIAGALGWAFGNHPEGAAYLIRRFNDTGAGFFNWEIDKLLKPSDGQSGDRFGASVSSSSLGTVIVGAPSAGNTLNGIEGAVYLFKPPVSVPFEVNEVEKIISPEQQTSTNFATQVDSDGAFIAVSDPGAAGGVVRLYQEADGNAFPLLTTLQSGDSTATRVGRDALALSTFNVIAGGVNSGPGGVAYVMTDQVFLANFEL